ncbi:MAG TPA: hypothetical protein VFQ07_14320 [Candidatus Polarisedimenticolia bacterium]|nr:hypothetical protein [Candidatus Polarisedimenticolia bacterium]
MKISMRIDAALLVRARARAAKVGVSLRDIIEAALREYLKMAPGSGVYRLRWRTEQGTLRTGIDLDSRQALFDAMESRKRTRD